MGRSAAGSGKGPVGKDLEESRTIGIMGPPSCYGTSRTSLRRYGVGARPSGAHCEGFVVSRSGGGMFQSTDIASVLKETAREAVRVGAGGRRCRWKRTGSECW